MNKLLRTVGAFALITAVIASSSAVDAGEKGRGSGASGVTLQARDRPESGKYGVGVTPAIYLINFILMYISNPNNAANMPAYRTPIPLEVSECLDENPGGCSYFDYARFFDERAFRARAHRDKRCSLPPVCQTTSAWTALAPPVATKAEQLNEPIGLERANQIAASLHIEKDMVLTDREYQCTIGSADDRTAAQMTISSCIRNLSNSNGTTNIPLSSYGLAITDPDTNPNSPLGEPAGNAQSLCAPFAPCLEFNDLFAGPLEEIAAACGWERKLSRMLLVTPFVAIFEDAAACQASGGSMEFGPCTVPPDCS